MNTDPALLTSTEGRELGRILADILDRLDRLEASQRSSQLEHTSLHNGSLEVRDPDSTRTIFGLQPDGKYTTVDSNGPPPPPPSLPVCTAVPGGFTVHWDGVFTAGAGTAVRPSDWRRVDVHVDLTTGFTPTVATVDAAILVPDGATLHFTTGDYVPHYVRLVAVNTSGVWSTPTAQVAVTPLQLAAGDVAPGAVGSIQLANGAVEQQHLTAELILATAIYAGNPTAAHIVLDGAANELAAYRPDGTTRTFLMDGDSGDVEMLGVFRTAPSGERLIINEGNSDLLSARFYEPTGPDYASIYKVSASPTLVMAGVSDTSDRTGFHYVTPTDAQSTFGQAGAPQLSRMHVSGTTASAKAGFVALTSDHSQASIAGIGYQTRMAHTDSSGNDVATSYLGHYVNFANEPWLKGPNVNAGLVFTPNGIVAINAGDTGTIPLVASAFTVASARRFKDRIRALDRDPLETIRTAPVYRWQYPHERTRPATPGEKVRRRTDQRDELGEWVYEWVDAEWSTPPPDPSGVDHIGPLAEDLPPELLTPDGEHLDLHAMTAWLWVGEQKLDRRADVVAERLATLRDQLIALTARVDQLSPP